MKTHTNPFSLSRSFKSIAACVALAGACAVGAQTAAPLQVTDAWVRASVPGQSGTGAFMKLTAPAGGKLVGVSTPAAGVAEVHEMKMEGDTMKMREVPAIELPAKTVVELKPGGYHVMLMDLKQPLANGASVPLTLRFEDAKGAKSSVDVSVPVRASAAAPAAGGHKH